MTSERESARSLILYDEAIETYLRIKDVVRRTPAADTDARLRRVADAAWRRLLRRRAVFVAWFQGVRDGDDRR